MSDNEKIRTSGWAEWAMRTGIMLVIGLMGFFINRELEKIVKEIGSLQVIVADYPALKERVGRIDEEQKRRTQFIEVFGNKLSVIESQLTRAETDRKEIQRQLDRIERRAGDERRQ